MTDVHDDVKGLQTGTPLSQLGKPDAYGKTSPQKLLVGLVGLVVVGYLMWTIFLSFGLRPEWYLNSRFLIGIVAIITGVGGAAVLFWFLNMFIEGLPQRLSLALIPYAYLLPGFGLMSLMLLYPAVSTIRASFANADTTAYVGFENYRTIFGDPEFRNSLLNNLLWLLVVPAITVALGIAVAVLADKLSSRAESISKSIIFLPMAISFVGAAAIWKLVYAYDNPGATQTGLLNWIWVNVFRGDPQTWLNNSSLHLNSFLMMVILVWLQVGFAMTLLSSAIKGVPEDTLEAARIDGASEWQIFSKVVLPQIKGTTITVFITVLILVLKIFDIVYVLTNGRFNSNVIANLFFLRLFKGGDNGVASAIVVVLLLAVMPVLVYQVRHFRAQEGEPMTSDTISTEAAMAGGTSVPHSKPRRVPGQMKDGRRRSWTSIVSMLVLCLLWTVPTLGLLVTSFRNRIDASQSGWWTALNPANWGGFTFQNYSDVLSKTNPKLDTAFLNSVVVAIPATVLPIMFAAFAAYAFTFASFRGKDVLFIAIVAVMVVPIQVAFLPMLKLLGPQHLDIVNQYFAVWLLHTGFGMPLAIYTLRNYMSTLPKTVIESAKIDGATHYQTFWRLIVPMSVPALAAFAILQFLWVWNDLLIAKLFLGSGDNGTVIVALQGLLGTQGQGQELLTAAAFISMVLPMAVFFGMQRFFVRGLTSGAEKG